MDRCLITGCGGFIGSHLAEFLLGKGLDVYGIVHRENDNIQHLRDRLNIIEGNILHKNKLAAIVREIKPHFVFHLASLTLVTPSWQNPEKTLKINILGTLYLLESIRRAGINPAVEVMGSSSEYGNVGRDEAPIKESSELHPSSPYGVSKVAEDMMAFLYWQACGLRTIRVRPFSVTGPRKSSDVCSDFARGIAEVEAGLRTSINVGNLEAVRDFVDIKDAVEAMWLLIEKGVPGEVYNICSQQGTKIKDILDKLVALSGHHIEIHGDPHLTRPIDEPVRIGDNSKLRRLGWQPYIPLEKTLSDMLDYWRASITSSASTSEHCGHVP